jgi:hypothetical protein
MTVSEMTKVYNMDLDQFETYALGKGYTFSEIKNEDNIYGHIYSKGIGNNTKFLSLYTEWFEKGKNVNFQTWNSSEFLNIKNQLKNLGFVLQLEEDYKGVPYKRYRNSKYELNLFSVHEGGYEIGFSKY